MLVAVSELEQLGRLRDDLEVNFEELNEVVEVDVLGLEEDVLELDREVNENLDADSKDRGYFL